MVKKTPQSWYCVLALDGVQWLQKEARLSIIVIICFSVRAVYLTLHVLSLHVIENYVSPFLPSVRKSFLYLYDIRGFVIQIVFLQIRKDRGFLHILREWHQTVLACAWRRLCSSFYYVVCDYKMSRDSLPMLRTEHGCWICRTVFQVRRALFSMAHDKYNLPVEELRKSALLFRMFVLHYRVLYLM